MQAEKDQNVSSEFGFAAGQRGRHHFKERPILNVQTLTYIGIILTILSLIIVTFLHYRKSGFCKGHRFSNAVKIMIFMSDVQNYVPIKLCKAAGSIHLFKITGMLKAKNIKLNKNYLWNTLEIDWKEVTVTFSNNKIDLPEIVVIKLQGQN